MWLHVRNSEGTITGAALAPGTLLIGRDAASDVFIADERASRQHSRLTTEADGAVWVEDLGSTNGTWVNGTRITGPTAVTEGDEIRVGSHLLQLTPGPLAEPAVPRADAPPTVAADAPVGAWPAPVPAAAQELAPPAPDWGAPVNLAKGPDSGTPYATPYGAPYDAPATTALPAAAGGGPGSGGASSSGGRRGYIFGGFGLGAAVVAVVIVIVLFATGGGSGTLTPGKISAKWGPNTLYVLVDDGGQPVASGSGWVYNAGQGLIVTNAHVVDAGTTYSVGQGSMKQKATLVAVAPCEDLAVLKIAQPGDLKTFKLGSQADIHGGDPVTALGYPEGGTQTPSLATTTGVVSVVKTGFQQQDSVDVPAYTDLVQTTAPINPGNSGGPLLNAKGQLIGINTAGITEDPNGESVQGEGFAIGVDRVKEIVPGLAAGHSIGYTGMDLDFPTSAQDFQDANVPEVQGGVIVTDAVAGSPAAKAGFGKFGDAAVITSVNGHNLDGKLVNYCNAVGKLTSGQSATFKGVQSDGSEFTISVPFE